VFLGLSAGNILTPDMLLGMANDPIVLRWQIQIPKLNIISLYKKDLIMATGRSDYPNQVNNVLGFPYILELLMYERQKNEAMKMAVKAFCYKSLFQNK
jgi:malate dehydrogenase (oxaloacetate-decarboxylating)(NADP+)